MTLDTVTTLLVAITPALSAIFTIIGGLIAITRKAKKKIEETESNANRRIAQTQRDIALIKAKLSSIERILSEREEQ